MLKFTIFAFMIGLIGCGGVSTFAGKTTKKNDSTKESSAENLPETSAAGAGEQQQSGAGEAANGENGGSAGPEGSEGPEVVDPSVEGSQPGSDKGQQEQTPAQNQAEVVRACTDGGVASSDYQVLRYSGGDVEVALTEETILHLDVTGNAQVLLPNTEVKNIKGICIYSSGGSAVAVETSFGLGHIYYHGRGNATSTIEFNDGAEFASLTADISGGHGIAMTGAKAKCDALDLATSGASQITCL